jgi:hypothetical protein
VRITHYSFGRITVDGRTYTSDVIIYPGRVDSSWWRKEGHRLQPADLQGVVEARPGVLVIGTGHSGVMEVPEETVEFLKSKGIEVRAAPTAEAVRIFNGLSGKKAAVAALHLTC